MMINKMRQWLYEPHVRDLDVDDVAMLSIHRSILQKKKLLNSAFETFYTDMSTLCDLHFRVSGQEIELGSGAGFFKKIRPAVTTSDIREGENIDLTLDAQNMTFANNSVRCVYAINVFHHLPNPEKFLHELERVLMPGGGCILIEPHGGFASASLHKVLHKDEHFDPTADSWKTTDIRGPLSGANQALAHIVFTRDRSRFESTYGQQLEIISQGYELNSLRYLLSGGLNFRQFAPSLACGLLASLESIARPLAKFWSLHQVTVIKKK